MTSPKPTILIMDSTTVRCEELCALWANTLNCAVVFSEGGPFYAFPSDRQIPIDINSLIGTLNACLFHQGDKLRYRNSEIKKLVDSCQRVVVFGGTGIVAKGDWPDDWFWIPRAIGGKRSARGSEWEQFAAWLSPNSSLTTDAIDLLQTVKNPHFLVAIHILCQGFLAGERMRERVPTAGKITQTRDWWAVPLIKSAGAELLPIVSAEWGANMPDSVSQLVEWIAGEFGNDAVDLASLVPEVKQEIEKRLSK